jgi:hypothetical protein
MYVFAAHFNSLLVALWLKLCSSLGASGEPQRYKKSLTILYGSGALVRSHDQYPVLALKDAIIEQWLG